MIVTNHWKLGGQEVCGRVQGIKKRMGRYDLLSNVFYPGLW